MKTIITISLLSILIFFGCDQQSDITSSLSDSPDQQLIKISSPGSSDDVNDRDLRLHRDESVLYDPGTDEVFIPLGLPESELPHLIKSKVIEGDDGGRIKINYSFETSPGDTISICAKLVFPEDAFNDDEREFTMVLHNDFGRVSFYPHMDFNKPVKFSVTYTGIDLSGVDSNLVDFTFQNYDGSTEQIEYREIRVNVEEGVLELERAKLHHFSRYGWIRNQF